jgi:hypothetical protein
MNHRLDHNRQQVLTRCERDGWISRNPGGERSAAPDESQALRFSTVVANASAKRRQVIERMLERTLASYSRP